MQRVNPILALVIVALVLVSILIVYSYSGGTLRVPATTTTSLYATGLLDALADKYREDTGANVEFQFIAVGSGEALRRAAQGDACMVFVHAPSLEIEYIREGILVDGRIFAYNYFIIVGPPEDPANVREAESAVDAFRRIYEAGEQGKAIFVSRGDNSGTHVKELSIWEMAGLDPRGKPWYKETGSGMAETLMVASELGAYTLSDIGTFLKVSPPGLEILYSNSTELINIYSVYRVASCTGPEAEAVKDFIAWIVSPQGQEFIAQYGVEEYGQPLFYPALGKEAELKAIWEQLAGLQP